MINCHPNNAYLRCTTERRVKSQMNTFAVKQSNSQKRKKTPRVKLSWQEFPIVEDLKYLGKIALNACKTHSVNPCYFEKVKDSSYQELVQQIPRITFWISKMNDHPIILNHVYLQRTNNWNIVTDGKKKFFSYLIQLITCNGPSVISRMRMKLI